MDVVTVSGAANSSADVIFALLEHPDIGRNFACLTTLIATDR